MPALEDNLLIVFFVLCVLAALSALGFALWKPILGRAWRYLKVWYERDRISETEAKRLAECRARAEAEMAGKADDESVVQTSCVEPIRQTDTPPVYQKLKQ